jgi:cold shock CspA family protein
MPDGEVSAMCRTGRVEDYDAARGWGTIAADDGERLGFHCTQIADGSRAVPVGARVRYERRPGHHGRWEATRVTVVT